MRKRWISVLLALVMVLGVLPAAAFAEDDGSGAAYVEGGDSDAADTEDENPGAVNPEAGDPGTVDTEIEVPSAVDTEGEDLNAVSEESGDFTIDESGVLTKYNGPGGKVVIPDSVTSIGEWAFSGCRSLTGVTIPASVTSVGGGAFSSCDRLTSINVDNGNRHYCSDNGVLFTRDSKTIMIFPAGKKDASYTIPDGVTSIGEYAFAGCSLTGVTIPNSVTSIGELAFSGCRELTGVTIPDSVTSIGDRAFQGCDSLTGVTIPDIVTSMGTWTFYWCKGLTSVVIGNGVTSIGELTFEKCSALTSVTIGSNVASIGQSAFRDCTSLAGLVIPDSVTNIGLSAFMGCTSLTKVDIPASVTSIERGAFRRCTGITEFRVDPANTSYVSDDGIIFSADRSTLVACPSKRSGDYTVPESVSVIMQFAFSCCTGLTTVTLSSHITKIDAWAFDGCTNLASVIVPIGVIDFGIYRSFEGCESLAVVYYEGTREQWRKDGNILSGLENVDIRYECKGPQDRKCPDEMTYSFGNYAGAFGYGEGYKIPLERYAAVYGNMPLADSLYSNADAWGGNCFGMSTTSAMFFQDGNGVSAKDFKSTATKPVDLAVGDRNAAWDLTLRQFIEIMQVAQFHSRISSVRNENRDRMSVMCDAVRAFRETGMDPPLVSIYGTTTGEDGKSVQGGHAMLAYDLVEAEGGGYHLKVYDPNYPKNASRFITLDPSNGSWSYPIDTQLTWSNTDPYGWISFTPYSAFYGVWSGRPGAIAERASSRADENQRSALLFLNSDNAEIYDANGNKVAEIKDGELQKNSRQDIFQMVPIDTAGTGTSAGNTALYLPPDLYTVKNTDNSLENFEATMVHVDQSAAVSTSGSSVTFAVNDRTEVNYARVNDAASGASTAYEITMKSTPAAAAGALDTLTVTGKLGQGDPSIAQVSGELFAENLAGAAVQDGGEEVSQDQLKDGSALDVSKIAGASGEITATLQADGTVVLSTVPVGVQSVYAASYNSDGRITGLVFGTLNGKTITFQGSVTKGSQIFLLDANRAPVCGRITIR